ncbi:MAG TPA: hypothetical protein VFV53_09425 [Candidatus Limnocylindrales bacterium]|nr:hypothetical protein [Candidatus Limnocylindrales bacterium]
MRANVREVEASAETRGLEELMAEGPSGEERPTERPAGAPPWSPTVDGHPLTAGDLGPNGDVVLDILARAARLTTDEARDLERDVTWRWGFLAIAAAVVAPAGASMPISRALARARGRADGRTEAISALDSAVAAIVRGRWGARSRAILIACIGNACLAVLVRDLIDQETFDVLFGPWREIMHH